MLAGVSGLRNVHLAPRVDARDRGVPNSVPSCSRSLDRALTSAVKNMRSMAGSGVHPYRHSRTIEINMTKISFFFSLMTRGSCR